MRSWDCTLASLQAALRYEFFARQGICIRETMLFSNHIPVSTQGDSPRPELLLLQVQRDNLVRHNRRLMQQIDELTRQIEAETLRISSQEARLLNHSALSA